MHVLNMPVSMYDQLRFGDLSCAGLSRLWLMKRTSITGFWSDFAA